MHLTPIADLFIINDNSNIFFHKVSTLKSINGILEFLELDLSGLPYLNIALIIINNLIKKLKSVCFKNTFFGLFCEISTKLSFLLKNNARTLFRENLERYLVIV